MFFGEKFRQPLQLLKTWGTANFEMTPALSGWVHLRRSPLAAHRSVIDNDGDLDVVVSVMDEKPLLLDINGANKSNWLTIQSPAPARTAWLWVPEREGYRRFGQPIRDSSGWGKLPVFQRPRLHFGLGSALEAEIDITWPGGDVQTTQSVKANQSLHIRQLFTAN